MHPWPLVKAQFSCGRALLPGMFLSIWVHSSVVRVADCRSAGPWFKSGCALLAAPPPPRPAEGGSGCRQASCSFVSLQPCLSFDRPILWRFAAVVGSHFPCSMSFDKPILGRFAAVVGSPSFCSMSFDRPILGRFAAVVGAHFHSSLSFDKPIVGRFAVVVGSPFLYSMSFDISTSPFK